MCGIISLIPRFKMLIRQLNCQSHWQHNNSKLVLCQVIFGQTVQESSFNQSSYVIHERTSTVQALLSFVNMAYFEYNTSKPMPFVMVHDLAHQTRRCRIKQRLNLDCRSMIILFICKTVC